MDTIVLPDGHPDLTDQVALVTGATSGLGWHFARLLAAAGARVAICGRREDRLKELKQAITTEGGSCAAYSLDMMDAEAVLALPGKVAAELGTVGILINNAGIPDAQLAMKMPLELIDSVIDTNLRGPFILACEVARQLKQAGQGGRIINISSIGAYTYTGNGAALYSITKAALARTTETLAVEWARYNINVNGVAPGMFSSEMTDGMVERMGDISEFFPRKRICQPSQLDTTILYLCSPDSECVTGTIIKVDDGQMPR